MNTSRRKFLRNISFTVTGLLILPSANRIWVPNDTFACEAQYGNFGHMDITTADSNFILGTRKKYLIYNKFSNVLYPSNILPSKRMNFYSYKDYDVDTVIKNMNSVTSGTTKIFKKDFELIRIGF